MRTAVAGPRNIGASIIRSQGSFKGGYKGYYKASIRVLYYRGLINYLPILFWGVLYHNYSRPQNQIPIMKGPLYYATYPDAGRSEATYGASGTDGTREMISWALPEGPVLLHQLPSPLLRLLADGNNKNNYNDHMGGCQNSGPFWGTLNNRCRIIIGTQKGTIILTTTYINNNSASTVTMSDAICCCHYPYGF